MCIACVMRLGDQESQGLLPGGDERPGVLTDWSAGDSARAAVVYRQLPSWSRLLFDLLAAEPDRMFPIAQLRTALAGPTGAGGPGGAASVEEICEWAAPFCLAVGRHLPVLIRLSASGEPGCQMEPTAARLFRPLARPRLPAEGGTGAG
jgi:hypothetical protein